MKIIKHDLGNELQSIRIIPLGDMHLGEEHTNLKELKKAIEYIANNDDVFTIINGDNIDNAIRASVGDIYTAKSNPMGELDDLIKILEPIKDKILAIISGNHERRTYKHTGIDPTKHVAWRLGCEDYYSTGNYLLFVSFGLPFQTRPNRRFTYSLYGTHGSGGGRLVGGKMNALERLSANIDADIYLHSHTHLPATFKQDYIRTHNRTKSAEQVTKLFVNTNAWLDYGGYGELFNYKPATITPVVIKLDGFGCTCEL